MFEKYQHIVRIDDPEVEGLRKGMVYLFSKLDGTNGQVWMEDGELHFGSRNREITLGNDNQGMAAALTKDDKYRQFFLRYPFVKLYGEFLIRNHVTHYNDSAWRKFYVFDVVDVSATGETKKYIPYEEYVPMLNEFGIEYIPMIAKLQNPRLADIVAHLDECTFLCDENRPGEGLVIKNYDYVNKYGRTVWGKIVRNEFKQKKTEKWVKVSKVDYNEINEKILNKFCTEDFIWKEYYKLLHEFEDAGLNPKENRNRGVFISRLLQRIYQALIEEEMWHIVKKLKNPTINFNLLKKEINSKVKETIPDLF